MKLSQKRTFVVGTKHSCQIEGEATKSKLVYALEGT